MTTAIDNARKALDAYDEAVRAPDDDPGYYRRVDAAIDCLGPLRDLLAVLRVEYAAEDYRYRDGLPMGEELVTNQEERGRYYGTRPVISRIVTDWERVS